MKKIVFTLIFKYLVPNKFNVRNDTYYNGFWRFRGGVRSPLPIPLGSTPDCLSGFYNK